MLETMKVEWWKACDKKHNFNLMKRDSLIEKGLFNFFKLNFKNLKIFDTAKLNILI